MVYKWCPVCAMRADSCHDVNHLAQQSYRADFMLGRRRLRKNFNKKADADSFEIVTKTDYKRGQFLPTVNVRSRTLFPEFLDKYIEEYVKRYMKGFRIEEYRLRHSRKLWASRTIGSLAHEDAEQYVSERVKVDSSQSTINREITSLKVMFKWAKENNYTHASPFDKVRKFKVDGRRVRWLSEQEIDILLEGCRTLKDFDLADFIGVAIFTGFRLENLKTLEERNVLDTVVQALTTKSGKPYDVPLHPALRSILGRLIRLRAPRPLLNTSNLRARWEALIEFTGIKDVTIHTLRHTFAAQQLRAGTPIDVVRKWMGHYSVAFTSAHYGHLCPQREQEYIRNVKLGKSTDTFLTLEQTA